LFAVDKYWTLDGAVGGSGAEIINHSCDPNLVGRVMKGHVLYMSLREIKPGEELTVDYHLDWNPPTTPCQCGTAKCRGTLELKKKR
jgi:SET domain-containing protein